MNLKIAQCAEGGSWMLTQRVENVKKHACLHSLASGKIRTAEQRSSKVPFMCNVHISLSELDNGEDLGVTPSLGSFHLGKHLLRPGSFVICNNSLYPDPR